ncbi:MAG TPA: hypothetical protein PLM02_09145, partial [Azonexus sp.]|nr:hypothetical protein [Azonexus sp.]
RGSEGANEGQGDQGLLHDFSPRDWLKRKNQLCDTAIAERVPAHFFDTNQRLCRKPSTHAPI